jgi:hypothetical protein
MIRAGIMSNLINVVILEKLAILKKIRKIKRINKRVTLHPPLVQRYYEGDPGIGEKPGYLMTPEERRASANDRSRMRPSTQEAQRRQGAEMARYSKGMKKKYGL